MIRSQEPASSVVPPPPTPFSLLVLLLSVSDDVEVLLRRAPKSLLLPRGERPQRQRVDAAGDLVLEELVDGAVPRDGGLAGEGVGDDLHAGSTGRRRLAALAARRGAKRRSGRKSGPHRKCVSASLAPLGFPEWPAWRCDSFCGISDGERRARARGGASDAGGGEAGREGALGEAARALMTREAGLRASVSFLSRRGEREEGFRKCGRRATQRVPIRLHASRSRLARRASGLTGTRGLR